MVPIPDQNQACNKGRINPCVAKTVVSFAVSRGLGLPEVARITGMDTSSLLNCADRIPERAVTSLWTKLERDEPDGEVAFKLAASAPLAIFGGLADGALYAETLHNALDLVASNRKFIADHLLLQITKTPDAYILLTSHPLDSFDDGRIATLRLALLKRLIVGILGVKSALKAVHLVHSPRASLSAYEVFFGAPVSFEQENSTLVIRPEAMTTSLQHANAELFRHIVEHYKLRLSQVQSEIDELPFQRLQRAVINNADDGIYQPVSAAAVANLSLRSAQRLAAENGTSLQSLVEDAKFERAKSLLGNSLLQVSNIAIMLGYSDDRAFRRAFKRWAGQSPSQYRKDSG